MKQKSILNKLFLTFILGSFLQTLPTQAMDDRDPFEDLPQKLTPQKRIRPQKTKNTKRKARELPEEVIKANEYLKNNGCLTEPVEEFLKNHARFSLIFKKL